MDTNCFTQSKDNVEYRIILSDPDTLQCHITENDTACLDSKQLNMNEAAAVTSPVSSSSSSRGRESRLVAPRKHRKLPAPPPPTSSVLVNGGSNDVSGRGQSKAVYVVDYKKEERALSPNNVSEASAKVNAPPPRPPKPQLQSSSRDNDVTDTSTASSNVPVPNRGTGIPRRSGVHRPRSVDISVLSRNKLSIHISEDAGDDAENSTEYRPRALSSDRTKSIPRPMTFIPDKNSNLTSSAQRLPERKLSAGRKTPTFGSKSSLVETIRSSLRSDDDDDGERRDVREAPDRPARPPDVAARSKHSASPSLTVSISTLPDDEDGQQSQSNERRVQQTKRETHSRFSRLDVSQSSKLTGLRLRGASKERGSRIPSSPVSSAQTSPRDNSSVGRSLLAKSRFESPKTSPRDSGAAVKAKSILKSSSAERVQQSPKTSPRDGQTDSKPSSRPGTRPALAAKASVSPSNSPREGASKPKLSLLKPKTYTRTSSLSRYSPKTSPRDDAVDAQKDMKDMAIRSQPSSFLSKYTFQSKLRSPSAGRDQTVSARRAAPAVPVKPAADSKAAEKSSEKTTGKVTLKKREGSIPRPSFVSSVPKRSDVKSGVNAQKIVPGRPELPPQRGRTRERTTSHESEATASKVRDNDDSGINSSKDSDQVVTVASAAHEAGTVARAGNTRGDASNSVTTSSVQSYDDTFEVVRCADSMVSLFEIQEDAGGGGGELMVNPHAFPAKPARPPRPNLQPAAAETHDDTSLASTTLCSTEKDFDRPPDAVSSLVTRISTARHSPLYHGGSETERETPTLQLYRADGERQPLQQYSPRQQATASANAAHSLLVTQTSEQSTKPGLATNLTSTEKQQQHDTRVSTSSQLHVASRSKQGTSPSRIGVRSAGVRSPIKSPIRDVGQVISSRQRSVNSPRETDQKQSPRDLTAVTSSGADIRTRSPRNSDKSVSYISAQITSQESADVPAAARTITVQTGAKASSDDASASSGSSKPPNAQLSLLRRPNSPRTRSPLLVVKPSLIRRSSFTKDRKPPDSPRARSPVLGNPDDMKTLALTFPGAGGGGERGSFSSLGSDAVDSELKLSRGARPTPLTLQSEQNQAATSAGFETFSSSKKLPLRNSPVLAFPSALGRDQYDNNDAEEAPPALPPKGISPRASPVHSPAARVSPLPDERTQPPIPPPRDGSPRRDRDVTPTPTSASRLIAPRKYGSPSSSRESSPQSLSRSRVNTAMMRRTPELSDDEVRQAFIRDNYPPRFTSSIARITRSRDSSPVSAEASSKHVTLRTRDSSPISAANNAPPIPRPRSTPARVSFGDDHSLVNSPHAHDASSRAQATLPVRTGVVRQASPLGKPPRAQRTPSPDTAKNELAIRNRLFGRGGDRFAAATDSGGDSQSDSYATFGDVPARRKKPGGGILKQYSDDSDASECTAHSSVGGGRDSPSKKKVTFDRVILEKEEQKAIKVLRDQRRQDDLAKYVKRLSDEKSRQAAVARSTSLDSSLHAAAAATAPPDADVTSEAAAAAAAANEESKSGVRLRKIYNKLTDDQLKDLHKYFVSSAANNKKERQSKASSETKKATNRRAVLKHSNSDTDLKLYSQVNKVHRDARARTPTECRVISETDARDDVRANQNDDEYVTLSDMKIVLKCDRISDDLIQNNGSNLEMEDRQFDVLDDAVDAGTDLADVSFMLLDGGKEERGPMAPGGAAVTNADISG